MDSGRRPPFDFHFGRTDRNKRSHSQMETAHRSSPSPLFVRQSSTASDDHGSPPPRVRLTLPPLRHRYPGDGYDYRRPATSANHVIDLTSDDESTSSARPTPRPEPAPSARPAASSESVPGPARLPRFSREIIDLSAEASSPAQPLQPRRLSSPEVQFVSSRPRSRTESHPPQIPPFPNPHHGPSATELFLDQDDDVITLGSRTGVNLLRPNGAQRRPEVGRLAQILNATRGRDVQRAALAMLPTRWLWEDADEHPPRIPAFHGLPIMNYETVAFDLGINDEPPSLPTPKYDPPPPAPEGFTRDPTEEDTIVCPHCGDELAVGETEEKRQVWVVKACGHVYCGTCMNNRKGKRPKNAKGKGRADDPALPTPFSVCQANDCAQTRVSHKNDVMQIFL